MATSKIDGPFHTYGDMAQILTPVTGVVTVPDPNPESGPNLFFMASGLPDVRFFYPKDKVTGYTGVVPSVMHTPTVYSANAIPAALATNNIAAAQTVTNGTAMTLAGASTGVTLNVPISPIPGIGSALNGSPVVTAAVALDFGFQFGNCVSGNASVTVGDTLASEFVLGMPLVIGGVGNSAGTAPLLTNVATIVDATHITVGPNLPAANNATAPIGTGNLWGPSEIGFPVPTAALPFQARGPGLFLDPTQSIARGLQIAGTNAGCVGGNFLVSGWDIYCEPMTQLVTVAAGVSTGWTTKAFKYIASVVPQFTDTTAGHTYTGGTSDVFGTHFRSDLWETTTFFFGGVQMSTSVGWVPAVTTTPATNLTGDVRGTLQTSTNGGGSQMSGGAASNGTVVSLQMSGRRLFLTQDVTMNAIIRGTITNPSTVYGVTQA